MKPSKIILSLLLLAVLAVVLVFIGLNTADYFRYRYIMNLDKHLTPAEFKEMAETIASSKQTDYSEYSEADMPAIFKKIGTKSLTLYHPKYPGHDAEIISNVVLYERGKLDGDIFPSEAGLSIEIAKQNQKILIWDNFIGRPTSRTVWVSNPALEEQTNPRKILTLARSFAGSLQSWVVTKDAIIYSVSGTTMEKQPLTIFQSDAIGGAIRTIPSQIHGKRFYDAGIKGGLSIVITFDPAGYSTNKDIWVNNSWCPELDPLLNILRKFAPHSDAIPTKAQMVHESDSGNPSAKYIGDYRVQPTEEYETYPPIVTDWWIIWPKLFL